LHFFTIDRSGQISQNTLNLPLNHFGILNLSLDNKESNVEKGMNDQLTFNGTTTTNNNVKLMRVMIKSLQKAFPMRIVQ
jgi:hypothetical protein